MLVKGHINNVEALNLNETPISLYLIVNTVWVLCNIENGMVDLVSEEPH